ncbi:Ig-like domain-containing protein [Clostridium sp. DSM 17811]|uniref:Ig-like domain-containing protein n=1 Tax=Clostridium sp. DSM 17811 TaxID=2843317 RepID=UPI001C0E0980|nr:Ig-like domain-containing protein [Clostridium sp. DSM 17811]MBU3102251.1 Ig-like domain-containing protein [Clostridium sp. DSM 17811]
MNKKVISSFLTALMIVGASSISAFATTDNGSVVIGSKSFDLAYANDTKNSTEITNAIVEGGSIYVKDFSGNWIDNNTGKTVDSSVIDGEDEGQVTTVKVASANPLVITKNANDTYTLPTTVPATLTNGTTKNLAVTWDKVASTKVEGNYKFTGILTMADGVVNSNNVTITAILTITSESNYTLVDVSNYNGNYEFLTRRGTLEEQSGLVGEGMVEFIHINLKFISKTKANIEIEYTYATRSHLYEPSARGSIVFNDKGMGQIVFLEDNGYLMNGKITLALKNNEIEYQAPTNGQTNEIIGGFPLGSRMLEKVESFTKLW